MYQRLAAAVVAVVLCVGALSTGVSEASAQGAAPPVSSTGAGVASQGASGAGSSGAGSSGAAGPSLRVLSNRADLLSGGDALVELVAPPGAVVTVNGRDVSSALVPVSSGVSWLRVTGLANGRNALQARLRDGRKVSLNLVNHRIGGPVFSGPQLQPWSCDTEAAGLGPATDAQCNAPIRFLFFYKNAVTGQFESYDQNSPPPSQQVAMTTTDTGVTVPYVVRVETGTINRGIYDVAVLFDPSKPWEPWAPQAGWNGKLNFIGGCSFAVEHRQSNDRGCAGAQEEHVLADLALSRGFAVTASTLTHLGNNMNTVVGAETLMMVKERIAETYGPIRYTIGTGCSGGSIEQQMVAEQYPGILDGLRPECSFPDVWAIALFNGVQCPMLNQYFEAAPQLWANTAQRDAVYGYDLDAGPVTSGQGNAFCRHPVGAFKPEIWSPDPPSRTVPQEDIYAQEDLFVGPCVPAGQGYDAETNPTGVRCTPQDYMVNIFGRRPQASWGPVEKKIGKGFANRFIDNVGVQYGLKALERGEITAAQFADLNEKIGGWDIDANWQPARTEGDLEAIKRMYQTGQLNQGYQLANVPIIDYRGDWNNDVHSNRQAATTGFRLKKSLGTTASRAEWHDATTVPLGEVPDADLTFTVMDRWLAAIEADKTTDALPVKVVRNRPADAADGCFDNAQRAEPEACANYSLDEDPLLVAGMPDSRDVLKCQLKPLARKDYQVTFTDQQWASLQKAFPTGVCDWTKPGVGQTPNTPWLSYAKGPGGRPLGEPPAFSITASASTRGTTARPANETAGSARTLPSTGLTGLLPATALILLTLTTITRRRRS